MNTNCITTTITGHTGTVVAAPDQSRQCLGPKRISLFAVTMLLMLTSLTPTSFAISKEEQARRDAAVIARSLLPKDNPNYLTPFQEAVQFAINEAEYRLEHPFGIFGYIGQLTLDGDNPSIITSVGSSVTLQFDWINPDNGLQYNGQPIGSVLYEQSRTPDVASSFVPLGTSFDAGSDFSFTYTVSTVEEDIRAQPFDLSGNPIYLPGFESGDNIALADGAVLGNTPEPSTLLMFGSSTLALAAVLRRGLVVTVRDEVAGH